MKICLPEAFLKAISASKEDKAQNDMNIETVSIRPEFHLIVKTQFRRILALLAAISFAACASTTVSSPEYSRNYSLAEDVNLYHCYIFTGAWSIWFTGPQRVETICSSRLSVKDSTVIKKGSPVKVIKIFTTRAESTTCNAMLQITDRKSKTIHVVYINWPGSKSLLQISRSAAL